MATLSPEARAHRRDLAELVRIAHNDLRVAFRGFDTAEAARDGLRDILPALTVAYGGAAVTLAADWYEDLRDAAGRRGHFSPVLPDLPGRDRTDALARWAVTPLFQPEPDMATALVKVMGGFQRIIANADRQTVAASSVADPGARGWARAGAGQCDFCQMLIDRGDVYTEASADFDSHDHCGCIAVPSW